jgi:prefoldin subunit 5
MGFGRGRGRFQAWPAQQAAPAPETERNYLNSRADALQAELDSIRKRLSEIEKGETS